MKLNCHDLFDRVWYVMKTRQDNDMIDHTCMIYVKNDNEISYRMGSSAICDKNKSGQRRDRSYRCSLHKKTILNYHDRSDRVLTVIKKKKKKNIGQLCD